MLRNKALNQALELGTIYVWGWYLGLGGSNTADLPHSIPQPKRGALGDIPTCSVFTAIRADGSDLLVRNLLSHQLLFLIDMIQWRSYTGHTQRSSKLKFCLMLIPSNDVTKDDSKNSTFGAPLKKGNNYIFNMKPPYLWNLNWSQTQCEGLLFLEYKWWYFYTWLLKCLARGCYNSKRGQMTYATTIGQNMPIHVCANDTD